MFGGILDAVTSTAKAISPITSLITPGVGAALGGVGFCYVNAGAPTEFNIGIQTATVGSSVRFFNGGEKARITTNGELVVGVTSTVPAAGGAILQASGSNENWVSYVENTRTIGNTYCQYLRFSGQVPNDATSMFTYMGDTSGQRMSVKANGGIYNFSVNDSNLSDRREKTNFAPAKSYIDVICSIPVQTFNYIDQNLEEDGGLTLGVVAQDVQAVAPELVMESNWADKDAEPKMRLSIYQTDLQYALMKCIQEQQAIIESLKARLDAANL